MDIGRKSQAVIQNLKDAGCGDGIITAFMENIACGKVNEGLKLLAAHRRALLDDIHREQRQIDCLDYLVFIIKQGDIEEL